MDILDTAAIKLPCKSCDQYGEVPLRDILLSHETVPGGCPVPHATECPLVFQIRLSNSAAIRALRSAWTALSHWTEAGGGELVLLTASDKENSGANAGDTIGGRNACSKCA